MATEDRLLMLLERWVAEAEAGKLLSAADLCRDCPDLLPEAEPRVAVLSQFHDLAQPQAATEVLDQRETGTGEEAKKFLPERLPSLGERFARYRIDAEIDKGGMGIVFRAHDTQLDRDVALKVVRPEMVDRPGAAERFLQEARAMASIRHDHVVEVYDYGEVHGLAFLAMPLLAGETLAKRLDREGPLPAAEVIRIGTQLAEGLSAVHARGLLHRDLKPSNVWLEAPGDRVKLLDFGLARSPEVGGHLTGLGTVLGTPAYMSPEQVNGWPLDSRSDLFSLGSVLYEAATGKKAFAAPTHTAVLQAVGTRILSPAHKVNPLISPELSRLIEGLHCKDPAGRPASAAEVAGEFHRQEGAGLAPTTDWPANQVTSTGRTRFRQRPRQLIAQLTALVAGRRVGCQVVLTVAASLLILLGTLGGLTFFRGDHADRLLLPPANHQLPGAVEPLLVKVLNVEHFRHAGGKNQPQGVLGKNTFQARLDDDIKVEAHLSRPAYCYLIIFRADGQDEILYPQGAQLVPERTDRPCYPSRDLSKVYGLTEGSGLWLVVLVASDRELPSYAQWRAQHPGNFWQKVPGDPDVVWFHDGQWLEGWTPARGRPRGEREAPGTAPVVRVVDWLKAETGGTVSAVGFTVEEK